MKAPILLLNMLVFQTDASIGKFATLIAGPTATKDVIGELIVSAKVYLKNFYMQAIPYRCKKEELKELVAPMMLLVGRHDTFCEPENVVSRIRECLQTAQTEIVEDVGHVIYFEKPEFVNARILEFFDSDM